MDLGNHNMSKKSKSLKILYLSIKIFFATIIVGKEWSEFSYCIYSLFHFVFMMEMVKDFIWNQTCKS